MAINFELLKTMDVLKPVTKLLCRLACEELPEDGITKVISYTQLREEFVNTGILPGNELETAIEEAEISGAIQSKPAM